LRWARRFRLGAAAAVLAAAVWAFNFHGINMALLWKEEAVMLPAIATAYLALEGGDTTWGWRLRRAVSRTWPLWSACGRRSLTLTGEERRALRFAALWFVGFHALTVFLPVRSSLYAVLPSLGSALIVPYASAPER
jgi:hypothetical protein